VQRWVHSEKRRYYQADLIADLFGDWSLVTAWGGLDSHRGQVRRTWMPSREDGLKRLDQIGKRRRQRGYRAVSEP
jgi:hypothetical protein